MLKGSGDDLHHNRRELGPQSLGLMGEHLDKVFLTRWKRFLVGLWLTQAVGPYLLFELS